MLATTLLSAALALFAAPAAAPAARPAQPSLPSPPAPAKAPDPTPEALTDQLRIALLDHSDAEQDDLLRSLRQLRDPGLRPLFAQITTSPRAVLRIHGILGLAELETPPRIDLLLVRRIPDAREQLVVLGEALRAGMLQTEQLEDVARWSGLDPAMVVLVLGRLQRAGVEVEPAAFDPYIRGDSQEAAIYAALELRESLARAVGGAQAADTVLERILALPRAESATAEVITAILDYIRDERLGASAWFAVRLIDPPQPPPLPTSPISPDPAAEILAFDALRALLTVAPAHPRTFEAFRGRFQSADVHGRRFLGLAVLDAIIEQPLLPNGVAGPPAPALPPELFALLRDSGDPLLAQFAAAGEAAMLGCSPQAVAPIADLIADPRPGTLAWAARYAAHCRGEEARALNLAILDGSLRGQFSHPDFIAPGLTAAAALADAHPTALLAPLAEAIAAGDIAGQRLILAGALRSTNPASGALGRPPTPLLPFADEPLVACLATLLRTRHSETLTEDDFRALAAFALSTPSPDHAGDGSAALPDALRVQAAWLALRARNQQRIALTRILADSPRAEAPTER